MIPNALRLAYQFSRTRWALNFTDPERLEVWQQRQLKRFLRDVLPRAPYFRGSTSTSLSDFPIMDKASMMENFDGLNTCGVTLDQALTVALSAEESRDFAPTLKHGLTVGLSSGTSGNRGVFMVSQAERLRWAGIMLARSLPTHLLRRLFTPWLPPIRIGFFLRANSNLYTTLDNRRIHFSFNDLLLGVEPAISSLNHWKPDVLVGPPALLSALAIEAKSGHLSIQPSHVVSVADKLEDADHHVITETFGVEPHQLYQATEGFLAYTCERGALHLNETFVHIEPDWLDNNHRYFQPIITDFSRHTQLIVRYRLNDVLRTADRACPCGRAERTIAAIEGRSDEVLWLPSRTPDQQIRVFPDQIRRAMLMAGPGVREFSVIQSGLALKIGLLIEGDRVLTLRRVNEELVKLWHQMGVQPPALSFMDWLPPKPDAKRRRIHREHLPAEQRCAF